MEYFELLSSFLHFFGICLFVTDFSAILIDRYFNIL